MPLSISSIEASSLMFQRNINAVNRVIQTTLEQLSTGSRVNRVSDDVAAYIQLSKTDTTINAYTQALQNTQNGISLTNIASGALTSVNDDLDLAREYALKASSDLLTTEQRDAYQDLANKMAENIVTTLKNANFNNAQIFSSDVASSTAVTADNPDEVPSDIPDQETNNIRIQVGIDSSENSAVYVDTGVNYGNIVFNLSSSENASQTIDYIDELSTLTTNKLAEIGSSTSLLSTIADNQSSTILNLSAARSVITDLDYAQATVNLVRNQLLIEGSVKLMMDSARINSGIILNLVTDNMPRANSLF